MQDKTAVGRVTGVAIVTLQPNSESAIAIPLPMHSTSGVDQGLRVFSQQSDALQCFHVEIGPNDLDADAVRGGRGRYRV